MSVWLAGIAAFRGELAYRCDEHRQAGEIDATARSVLITLAKFAGSEDNPLCFAAVSTIAKRSGISVRAVRTALGRLEQLGLIENVGRKKTVRWRLTVLVCTRCTQAGSCVHEVHTSNVKSARGAHKESAPRAHKESARGAHNHSEESESVPKDKDSDDNSLRSTGTASPPRSAPAPTTQAAGAQGTLSAPGGRADLVPWVAEQLNVPHAAAQRFVTERLGRSRGPVGDKASYIRACVDNELKARAANSAPGAGAAEKPAPRRRGNSTTARRGGPYRERR